MRCFRERLGTGPSGGANAVARNGRSYDGRPACVGNNSCQPICPVNAQYLGINAVEAAEAGGPPLLPTLWSADLSTMPRDASLPRTTTARTRARTGSLRTPSSSPPTALKAVVAFA